MRSSLADARPTWMLRERNRCLSASRGESFRDVKEISAEAPVKQGVRRVKRIRQQFQQFRSMAFAGGYDLAEPITSI